MGCTSTKDYNKYALNRQNGLKKRKTGVMKRQYNKIVKCAQDIIEVYDQEKQREWLSEVQLPDKEDFKSYDQWIDTYCPKKSGQEGFLYKQLIKGVKKQVSKGILLSLCKNLAFGIDRGAQIIKQADPEIYSILNSIVALLLTYRFQKLDKDKFIFLRAKAIDRFGFTFINYVEKRIQAGKKKILYSISYNKLKDISEMPIIDEDTINDIINEICQMIYTVMDQQSEKIIFDFMKSMEFCMPDEYEKDVQEGLTQLAEIFKQQSKQGMEKVIQRFKQELPKILQLMSLEQQILRYHLALCVKNKMGTLQYNQITEWKYKTSEKTEAHIQNYYLQLKKKINSFVSSFIDFMLGRHVLNEIKDVKNRDTQSNSN